MRPSHLLAATLVLAALVAAPIGVLAARGGAAGPGSRAAGSRALGPQDTAALRRALDGVAVEALRADIAFLASDEMGGRDTPSAGLERAADYLEERLRGLGFAPGARDGFTHRWPRSWAQLDPERSALEWSPVAGRDGAAESSARRLVYGADYYLIGPRELGDLSAAGEAVSVGSGSSAEVRRAELAGRWAVTEWPSGSVVALARRVREAGGVGLLVLPGADDPAVRLRRTTAALLGGRFDRLAENVFPTPVLGRPAARSLLAAHGGRLPAAGESLGVRLRETRRATHPGGYRLFENVCGLWPGDDPELAREVVVVSAHYDHVGTRDGQVYNGADDNASGTTGLLAIAEALERYGPMRRSVLLVWVSGEEKGLWGSEGWTRRPWLPAGHRPICNVNIDMIGRNAPDDLCITPTRRLSDHYNGLVRLAEENAPREGFGRLRSADAYWRRSDHMNFAERLDLPVTFLFADVHDDYHEPTDDPSRIDHDKVRRVTRLVLRMLDGLQGSRLRLHRRPVPGVEAFQARVRRGWIDGDLERLLAATRAHALANGGALPDGSAALAALDLDDPVVAELLGERLPADPWGRDYVFASGAWVCLGADGATGGRGEDADTRLAALPR